MTGIIALDDKFGYSLFGKRLSRDIRMLEDIVSRLDGGQKLYVSDYTLSSFPERLHERLSHPIPSELAEDAVIYQEVDPVRDGYDRLIVYRWNRHYPSDAKYRPEDHGYRLVSQEDFAGKSHEKITREVYEK